MNGAALLLDIDGVVVFECRRNGASAAEILHLHRELPSALKRIDAPVFMLTHRSRAEAHHILESIGLRRDSYQHCFTANDIFRSGIGSLKIGAMLSHGLRKSLILPLLQKRHGLAPSQICFVDDSRGNIADMHANGVGYTLLAPSELASDTRVVTFDFNEVVSRFDSWRAEAGAGLPRTESLTPVSITIEPWRSTGHNTHVSGQSAFNRLRRSVRSLRKRLRPS